MTTKFDDYVERLRVWRFVRDGDDRLVRIAAATEDRALELAKLGHDAVAEVTELDGGTRLVNIAHHLDRGGCYEVCFARPRRPTWWMSGEE